jgi:ABC-type Fe3+/spermidine/putrescine transport system ATPase subunit
MNGSALAEATDVVIRPEQLQLTSDGAGTAGTITAISFLGALTRIAVKVGEDVPELLADVLASQTVGLSVGDRVSVSVRPDAGPVVATSGDA